MPLYRSKPGVVEARQVNSADAAATTDLIAWCRGTDQSGATPPHVVAFASLGATLVADDTDWVARTDRGDFYRVNAQLFPLIFETVG